MSKFKNKKGTQLPEISTASLPDIVFMLLFFFMVATKMRKDTLMIKNELPYADQVEKLDNKSLIMNIYAGKPSSRYKNVGTEARIQLNDKFAEIKDIKAFILAERASKPDELVPFLITSLKVDKDTNMGLVGDIKKELREIQALKINYTTRKGMATDNLRP
ncbi:biopolymer transporter ExbD [Aquimarina sp. AD10]|uniref:ExbD/TolR family protein n=1 Tax=Aquimarina sp. AD10 TaxID=1714849 RepID=UPI000E53DEF0|nr:biopolymer transporter ExbD [Aquimarina sp. AD10]AXT61270.1 biopolymer transporter ExbD [Aquimarina sp. AD10]RKN01535.1 biopolymer transporter ExbD [Aquimarina sp. AD10]